MMSTRRSLWALMPVLLVAFGMASPASAQTVVPGTNAVGDVTGTAAVGSPAYSSLVVGWTIGAAYKANCGSTTGNTTDCATNETPLDGFKVYYSTKSGFTAVNAEGSKEVAPFPGTPNAEAQSVAIALTGLEPEETYYFLVAAVNKRERESLRARRLARLVRRPSHLL